MSRDPGVASEVLRQLLCQDPCVESMGVLVLDGRSQIRHATLIAQGGRNTTSITPAEIFRPVLLAGGNAFILGHNHPRR